MMGQSVRQHMWTLTVKVSGVGLFNTKYKKNSFVPHQLQSDEQRCVVFY